MRGIQPISQRLGHKHSKSKELQDNPVRRGWAYFVSEDTLGLMSIMQSRRFGARDVTMQPEQYRAVAHRLFTASGNKNGVYVNATQGFFLSRLRGVKGMVQTARWFSAASIAADGATIQIKKNYTPAQRKSLTSRVVAERAFLSNVFSHDGMHVAR
jgi:hypothetical protein